MYFDSESFIKEMESMQGIEEEEFINYEDIEEYEIITERELKNDL